MARSGLPLAANSGAADLVLSIEGAMDTARVVQPDVIGTIPNLMEHLQNPSSIELPLHQDR